MQLFTKTIYGNVDVIAKIDGPSPNLELKLDEDIIRKLTHELSMSLNTQSTAALGDKIALSVTLCVDLGSVKPKG